MLITALALFYPLLFIAISTMHENLYIYTINNMTVQCALLCSYGTLTQLLHWRVCIVDLLYMNNHINHLATYNNYASYSCMWHSNFVTCTSCSPVQDSIADLKPQCCSHPSDLLHKLLSLFLLQVQHIPVLEQSQGSDQPVMRKSQGIRLGSYTIKYHLCIPCTKDKFHRTLQWNTHITQGNWWNRSTHMYMTV